MKNANGITKSKFKLKKRIAIFFVVLILLFSCMYMYLKYFENNTAENDMQEVDNGPTKEEIAYDNYTVCIETVDDGFLVSQEYSDRLKNLENYNATYSIAYKELTEDKLVFSYNSSSTFYGESIVKLPFAMYIYDLAKEDPSILEKELNYVQSLHYKGGSGIMQDMDLSRPFTVEELIKHMIEVSDNIAFWMLLDEFDKYDASAYWKSKGATTTFVGYDNFGTLNGDDVLIYLDEVYNLLQDESGYYDKLLSYMNHASKGLVIETALEKEMYFKYGGYSSAYHEIAVINDDKPYALGILTSKIPNYNGIVTDIALEIDSLHDLYWQEKEIYCSNKYLSEED